MTPEILCAFTVFLILGGTYVFLKVANFLEKSYTHQIIEIQNEMIEAYEQIVQSLEKGVNSDGSFDREEYENLITAQMSWTESKVKLEQLEAKRKLNE